MGISLSYGRGPKGDAAPPGVGEVFRGQLQLQHRHADEAENDEQRDRAQGKLLAAGDR